MVRKLFFIVFILSLFLFLLYQPSLAKKDNFILEEAIESGIENNHELKNLAAEIKDIKHEIELLKAQYFGYDLNLVSNLERTKQSWYYEEQIEKSDEDGQRVTIDEEEKNKQEFNFRLVGNKAFNRGLELDYGLNFNRAKKRDNISYNLEVSQRLFPFVPLKGQQEIYRQENELTVAKTRYQWKKEEKIIDWLEIYLELLRLEQKVEISQESYQLAKNSLDRTLNLRDIGEVGRKDVLEAEINLEETKIKRQELSDRFKQQQKRLFQELGIEKNRRLELSIDNSYLEKQEELVENLGLDFNLEQELLVEFEHYPELKANKLKQSLVKKEREWSKLENRSRPLVTLEGSYEYQYYQERLDIDRKNNSEWYIGINLEYNLFDSGVNKFSQMRYEDKRKNLKREEDNLTKELKLKIRELLKELDRNYLERRKENLAIKRAQLQKEEAQERLYAGAINKEEFKENQLKLESSQVDLKAAKDQILVTKLKLEQIISN